MNSKPASTKLNGLHKLTVSAANLNRFNFYTKSVANLEFTVVFSC